MKAPSIASSAVIVFAEWISAFSQLAVGERLVCSFQLFDGSYTSCRSSKRNGSFRPVALDGMRPRRSLVQTLALGTLSSVL
ncbi:hypothetical protein [Aureimonas psammosilenae]|uniref:hypothetical protein n=1 Tax=Aureimonas psammosilenae TaxID=2495496 RepID=UPI0012612DDF|nr:hypothetical protein [Aureimonas psammosilenae]